MAGLAAPQFLQLPVGMRFMSSVTHARIASIVCAVTCTGHVSSLYELTFIP